MVSQQLIDRARKGDRLAFSDLYSGYYRRIVRCAEAQVRNRHDAEDIAQQVAMKLLTARPDWPRTARDFENWLFSIVGNTAKDHLRRGGRLRFEAPEQIARRQEAGRDDAGSPHDGWRLDEDLMLLMRSLPERQRQLLLTRYAFGLSSKDTAAVFDWSLNSVHQNERRALRRLAARLAPASSPPSGPLPRPRAAG